MDKSDLRHDPENVIRILEKMGITTRDMIMLDSDKGLAKRVKRTIRSATTDPKKIISFWESIYKRYLGKIVDFSKISLPEFYDAEKHFVVIVAKDTTAREIVHGMEKHFEVGYHSNTDGGPNKREPKEDYVILFSKNEAPDKEYTGKQWYGQTLDKNNINCITLLERLLLELLYFDSTGKHLDTETQTVCAGSRCVHPYQTPVVYWNLYQSGDKTRKRLRIAWTYYGSETSWSAGTRVVVTETTITPIIQ